MKSSNIYTQLGHQTISTAKGKELAKQAPEQELKTAIEESNQILFSASTVFPWITLFPDSITIDRSKVSIARRFFFQSADEVTIRMEDLLNISATVGPFFGSVTVTSRIFNEEGQSRTIKGFWRDDALRLKHIGQGYIIALQKEIDCSPLDTPKLIQLLEELGTADHPN